MCIYTMSIHSVYLVSDLEVSDNGDLLNGIIFIFVAVSHGLVTVLETLKDVSRTMNEYEGTYPLPTNLDPCS